jgi:hypothetical protein
MPQKQCANCGVGIEEGKHFCRSCNHKSNLKNLLFLAALIFVILPGIFYLSDLASARYPKDMDMDQEAEYICRSLIRSTLHDPSRAEFPLGSFVSYQLPDGSWHVIREVRAPNAFNAMRLGKFSCNVSYAGSPEKRYNSKHWRWNDVKQLD